MLIGAVPLLDVEDGRQGPAEGSVRSDLRRRPRRPLVALQKTSEWRPGHTEQNPCSSGRDDEWSYDYILGNIQNPGCLICQVFL